MPLSTKAAPLNLAKNPETGKFAIYCQYKGKRYWHLPTMYSNTLLRPIVDAANDSHKHLHLANRDVWSEPSDMTCERCSGKEGTECPRCAGKGWMSESDQYRWGTYMWHNYA